MISEIGVVLNGVAAGHSAEEIVIKSNALGKPTAAGRRIALQRLNELFGIERQVAIFSFMLELYALDVEAMPQLALLVGLARDPLFRASARVITGLAPGSELMRDHVRMGIQARTENQLNSDVLDKVVRNVSSSWAQVGHLEGRVFKRRRRIKAKTVSLALALRIAYLAGFRGEDIFSSAWCQVLDLDPVEAIRVAEKARIAGLIQMRRGPDGVEFSRMTPTRKDRVAHV